MPDNGLYVYFCHFLTTLGVSGIRTKAVDTLIDYLPVNKTLNFRKLNDLSKPYLSFIGT